jgi:hypothetical protein
VIQLNTNRDIRFRFLMVQQLRYCSVSNHKRKGSNQFPTGTNKGLSFDPERS